MNTNNTSTCKVISTISSNPPTPFNTPFHSYPIVDSGANNTVFTERDAHLLTDVVDCPDMRSAILSDGSVIISSSTGLYHPSPYLAPIPVQIFPDLTRSLISPSDFTDQGCIVVFSMDTLDIYDRDNRLLLTSTKDHQSRFWPAPTAPPNVITSIAPTTFINNVITHMLDAEYIMFTSACFGNPSDWTLINALNKGWLHTYPRATAHMVTHNLPNTIQTAQAHHRLNRQAVHRNLPLRSALPTLDMPEIPDDNVFMSSIHDIDSLYTCHTDAAGRFPTISRSGNQYLLITVCNNFIYVVPMSSRDKHQYVKAIDTALEFYTNHNCNPQFIRMDNETSNDMDEYMRDNGITPQYVPPNNHRANKAERAIRDLKDCLIGMLCSTNSAFPLNLWDEAIPQLHIVLNCLRPWTPNPNISAWHGLYGDQYNFVTHPIAPFGTFAHTYVTSQQRGSWETHGEPSYYLAPMQHHQKCFLMHIIRTNARRITDSVMWFPEKIVMPGSTPHDVIYTALKDIHLALQSMNVPNQQIQTTINPLRSLFDAYLPPHSRISTSHIEHPTIVPHPIALLPPDPNSPIPYRFVDQDDPSNSTNINTIPQQPVMYDDTQQRVIQEIPVQPQMYDMSTLSNPSTSLPSPALLPVHPFPTRVLHPIVGPTAYTMEMPDDIQEQVFIYNRKKHKPHHHTNTILPSILEPLITDQYDVNLLPPSHRRPPRTPALPQRYVNHVITDTLTNFQNMKDRVPYTQPQPKPITQYHTHINAVVTHPQTGKVLKWKDLITLIDALEWRQAEHLELVRLVDVTGTMRFIKPHEKPRDRSAAYYNPQPEMKRDSAGILNQRRIRGVIGGDQVDTSEFDRPSYCADMPTIKILFNHVVSQINGLFMTLDIKDFFLGTMMKRKAYMRIHRKYFPPQSIIHFQLQDPSWWSHDCIYVEVSKTIYGLPEAGKLSQEKLYAYLLPHGYVVAPNTPGLIRDINSDLMFSLVVDDFGVSYTNKKDVEKLISLLQQNDYELKIDWTGTKYLGLTINHDTTNRTLTISMPDYVNKSLKRFQYDFTRKPKHSPGIAPTILYGNRLPQPPMAADTSPLLSPEKCKWLQQVIGTFLYYARAVDPTILCEISKLASRQSTATEQIEQQTLRLLDYLAMYPNASIVYRPSKMILRSISDAAYLTETDSRSRAGGIHDLVDYPGPPSQVPLNGNILCISSILPTVVASAGEAEYGTLFINAQVATILRSILEDMGHPQPPTYLYTDNTCAAGIANRSTIQHNSKCFAMRYHWVRDRVSQGHFIVQWDTGIANSADYFTKTHPPKHHKEYRKHYVKDG